MLFRSQIAAAIKEHLSRKLPPLPDNACRTQPFQINMSPKIAPDKTSVRENLISAWFYCLPPEPVQLPCGADQYLLPILALSDRTARVWTEAIRQMEPTARILAWIPSSRYGRLSRILPGLLANLSVWGFDGICAGQPTADLAACLPANSGHLANSWIWTVDMTANVYNRCSLMAWLKTGAASVCPSVELGEEALVSLLRSLPATTAAAVPGYNPAEAVPQPVPVIEIPVYGHLRVMSNAFCPVGSNEPGCRI